MRTRSFAPVGISSRMLGLSCEKSNENAMLRCLAGFVGWGGSLAAGLRWNDARRRGDRRTPEGLRHELPKVRLFDRLEAAASGLHRHRPEFPFGVREEAGVGVAVAGLEAGHDDDKIHHVG